MSDNLPGPRPGDAPAPTRWVWMTIAFSMIAAVPIYGVVGWLILRGGQPPPPEPARELVWALRAAAALALVASALSLRLMPRATIADPTAPGGEVELPASIQQRSIVALALAETCCIIGFISSFFLRHAPMEYVWFGAGTLLVQLALVVPDGMRAWDAWEQRSRVG